MNVTYHCPACHKPVREPLSDATAVLSCPHCHQQITVLAKAIQGDHIHRCLVCPSTDLYARTDFPQRLGVALVIIGFVGSSIAWANYHVVWTFTILFATALIDLVLYIVMGESLTCYRCGAQYRGFADIETHGGFNLDTHERYRQMTARMKERPSEPARVI
jgi:hypothetical protein